MLSQNYIGSSCGAGVGVDRVDKWPAGIFAHCLEIYEHRMNDEVQEYRERE